MIYTLAKLDMLPPGLKERRLSFRHQVDIPVDLLLENGTALKVNACNLSLKGILFNCDDWISHKIESRGIQHHPLDHIQIGITAELDKDKKLYASSRIVIARRVSQDKYQIGLEFIDFQQNSDDNLQAYINSLNE